MLVFERFVFGPGLATEKQVLSFRTTLFVKNMTRMIIVMAPAFVVLFGFNSSTTTVNVWVIYVAVHIIIVPFVGFLCWRIMNRSPMFIKLCMLDRKEMEEKIVDYNRIASRSWGPLTSPNPPTGWWPEAWDEYVCYGDWGAVPLARFFWQRSTTLSLQLAGSSP